MQTEGRAGCGTQSYPEKIVYKSWSAPNITSTKVQLRIMHLTSQFHTSMSMAWVFRTMSDGQMQWESRKIPRESRTLYLQ